ncbi:ATP-dependent helicase [Clostridium sp. ZBS14]|uniref:ATP-dependent helicase n=1 Tax=Clostridium sp. ZBS14 TaxID=2949970 RepID=UPI00207A4464|nr:ATP-dependent helicase [Clostridium sp. ZBS14]
MERNDRQKEIIQSVKENRITLVEAPPGTGKTYTAVYLSMEFVKEAISSNLNKKVLILTFSKNARAQIVKQLEILNDGYVNYEKYIEITNYHSFYQKYIWAYSNYLDLPSNINIISPMKRKELIRKFIMQRGIASPTEAQINWATDLLEGDFRPQTKSRLKEVEKIVHLKEEIIEHIITLNREGYIAFSDFGYYMKLLVQKSKSFLNILRNKYKLIVLDEYQDSSDIQDFIVKELIGIENKAVFFADSKQMIYEWRGAKATRLSDLKGYYNDEIKSFMLTEVYRYKGSEDLLYLMQNARKGIFNLDDLRGRDSIKVIDISVDEKNINLYSPMIRNKCYSKMKYAILNELKKYKGKTVGILSRKNDIVDYLKEKFIIDFKINLNELSNNEVEHDFMITICEFITEDKYSDIDELARFFLWLTFEVTYEKEFGKVKRNTVNNIEFKDINNVRNEVVKKVKEIIKNISDLESMKLALIEYLKFIKGQPLIINNTMMNLALKVIKIRDISLEKVTSLLLQHQYNNSFKDLNGDYILNIHQSKGREFDVVFIIDSKSIIGDENLLYVALSRVKEEIVIFDWKAVN